MYYCSVCILPKFFISFLIKAIPKIYIFCTMLCDLKKTDPPGVVIWEEIVNITDDFDSRDALL